MQDDERVGYATGPQWGPTGPGPAGEQSFDEQRAVTSQRAGELVGHAWGDAVALGTSWGCTVRLVRRDSTEFVVTTDLSPRRINLEVEAGSVVAAWAG